MRAALLISLLQTPHRFRTKRQLWTYTGLGIETHSSAERRYVNGELQRSKKQISIRGLPPAALNALQAIPTSTDYYFWSGESTKKACVGNYQRAFEELYKLAEIQNGHAHRWGHLRC
jgi:transposase